MLLFCSNTSSSTPSADNSQKVFTTDGAGAYTSTDFVNKTLRIYEYATDGAGTLLGTGLYTFNSTTGALTGLGATTQYLALIFS